MTFNAPQKPVYAPGHAPTHIKNHTWRTAENSTPYLLPHLARLSQSNPTLRFLDVGAGPGTLTASIATHLPPTASIVATDISSDVLSRAAAHAAEKGQSNITTQVADVYHLCETFGANSFDVVHAHQVLCHLKDPLAALKSMLAVCKPDGLVAIRDGDFRMQVFHPETAGLTAFKDCIIKYHAFTGGTFTMGTELLSLAMRAGVPRGNVEMTMGTWCICTREEREAWGGAFAARCREGPMRTKAVGEGWYSEGEMDGMAEAWEGFIDVEDGVYGLTNGEIVITKP